MVILHFVLNQHMVFNNRNAHLATYRPDVNDSNGEWIEKEMQWLIIV